MSKVENRIGSRQLRQGLADYVRRAENGERFIVTIDRRPVASLGPLVESGLQATTLEGLAQLGLVERPRRRGTADQPVLSAATAQRQTGVPADIRVDRLLRQVRG